jgi:hypothetical protein
MPAVKPHADGFVEAENKAPGYGDHVSRPQITALCDSCVRFTPDHGYRDSVS